MPVPGTISWHVKLPIIAGQLAQSVSVVQFKGGSPQLGSWRASSFPGVAAAMAAPVLRVLRAIVMTAAVKRMM